MGSEKSKLYPHPYDEWLERKKLLLDEARPEAIAKRHTKSKRMIRELIDALIDEDSFIEYGGFAIAAQRGRRHLEELIKKTPADGLVCGLATIDKKAYDDNKVIVLGYDYTVLAGTQGAFNHKKTDRLLRIAMDERIPIIFYLEGGGGRPGDVDFYPISVGGLDISTFSLFASLDGIVPRIGIVTGYCFAGNAALAGCCDILIAAKDSSLGMGGPAMIEGGGLGIVAPENIGPVETMSLNGTIDIVVDDDLEATAIAKKCFNFYQGANRDYQCSDQNLLRTLIPEDRRWAYDINKIIHTLCDVDSVVQLKSEFGKSINTCLVRIGGRACGLVANNCRHLGGAIDADAADKMAGFLRLCEKLRLPVISLCDAPGFMVGPECEKQGMIKQAARLFTIGAQLSVPIICVVLRKAYGLGAMAMAGGSLHRPIATVAWPTGEFGAMGLEGAVKLAYKKELDAAKNEEERNKLYDQLVQQLYQQGKALNTASVLEIDDVIDPADTRKWISSTLF